MIFQSMQSCLNRIENVRRCTRTRTVSLVVCAMGNAVSYIAFIGACVDRKGEELSQYVEDEGKKSVHVSNAVAARRAAQARRAAPNETPRSARSPPLSARSRQSQADREDHLLLSARSIAIQKKAPLFRDNGEEEYLQSELLPHVTSRKLDMGTINAMVEEDRAANSGISTAQGTPQKSG